MAVRPLRRRLLDCIRIAVFAGIVFLIRDGHQRFLEEQGNSVQPITIPQAQGLFPTAHSLSREGDLLAVNDDDGNILGRLVQTAPESDASIGFSGSTNVLVAFDSVGQVVGIQVLQSADTPEHIDAVKEDRDFIQSFDGRTWEELGAGVPVEGVSGATLTSLAIADGIALRFGGDRPSYRFPGKISLDEAKSHWPECQSIQPSRTHPGLLDALGVDDKLLGHLGRTSPDADNLIGYQGPIDSLLIFNTDLTLRSLGLRSSYENQPYAGYIPQESSFLGAFESRSLEELASMNLEEEGIEGVSGATMTSMAMAEGVLKAATRIHSSNNTASVVSIPFIPKVRDLGTLLVVLFAFMVAFTRLRTSRAARVLLQVLLIVYLGFINGDILSQALLVGWAQNGIPWRLVPSLLLLGLAALLVPLTTRKQFYCHHLCPHGAAQQLLFKVSRKRFNLSQKSIRILELLPVALLGFVVVAAILHLPLSLVNIEPFDAYLFRVAGVITLSIAVVGLIASAFVPMAYCRFGCPTGAMLNLFILGGSRGGLIKRDYAVFFLLALALLCRFIA